MTLSSNKKYVSNFTSSTANRGVEAKEIEITNTLLGMEKTFRVPEVEGCGVGAGAAPPSPTPHPGRAPPLSSRDHVEHAHAHSHQEPDDTGSFIQVEVRRTRLPAASSPAPPSPPACIYPRGPHAPEAERVRVARAGGGGDDVLALTTAPALTACAGATKPPLGSREHGACGGRERGTCGGGAEPAAGDAPYSSNEIHHSLSMWKKFGVCADNENNSDAEGPPERVEVYYFERGNGAWLATSDGAREAGAERAARRAGRAAHALLAELCAVPRLVVGAPLAVLLAAERTALLVVRAAAAGALQTAADYAWKPALALLFNAVLHPPLVLAGNVARAGRDALRPVWGALGDALEPLARVLASVRLVHVQFEPRCSCAHTV